MSRFDALFDLLRGEVSTKDPAEPVPQRMPFDLRRVDAEAFLADIDALREELEAELGDDDLAHLGRLERIGRAATLVGVATAWLGPNPVSIVGLSLGRSTRWLLMHHCGHRGYDKVPAVPARYTSRVFARGRRRFMDWPDWMIPEAWNYEHNVLHHGHTGELRDPDLIERNTETLRALGIPLPLRYVAVAGLALTWRSLYYAPQTLAALRELRAKRTPDAEGPGFARELWSRCYAPYAALQFVALPALFAPLGPLAVASFAR